MPYFIVHDALYVPENKSVEVQELCERALKKYLGFEGRWERGSHPRGGASGGVGSQCGQVMSVAEGFRIVLLQISLPCCATFFLL